MFATRPLVEIQDLTIAFPRGGGTVAVVRALSLDVAPGARVALVGESGCGKSMTCLAIGRLPPTDRARLSGRICFDGVSLLDDPAARARLRGRCFAYVFQDPAASLNPVMRIGDQLLEALPHVRNSGVNRGEIRRDRRRQAQALLASVRLPDPAALFRAFPCELSGGMRQRVMLAMALACGPRLLIADEPTTALDVTTQAEVLDLIDTLVRKQGMSLLLVTHNLGLVAGRCDTLYVLYAGEVVESGPVADVLRAPAHPYTQALLRAVPRLSAAGTRELNDIPGTVPSPGRLPPGCAFAPRCPYRDAACEGAPAMRPIAPRRQCRCHHLPDESCSLTREATP
jgi:oligopeptide/dipeptide ABC transporter ATP-binding protein